MKILIASDFFAPTVNGIVTSIINLQTELERHGHDVKILTLKQKESQGYEDCVYLIPSFSAGTVYPGARIMRTFGNAELRDIEQWRPDVIHTNNEFSTFLLSQIMASKLEIPIVHTYHTVYEDYTHYFKANEQLGKGIVKKLSKNLLERTDSVVVPTEKVRDLLASYDVTTPVYTVPSGIDLERFSRPDLALAGQKLRRQWGIGEDDIVLMSLGRLAKEKNIEEIIGFLKDLKDNIRLVIVGGGPYQAVLESCVASKGLNDRVLFTGMVMPQEVPDYYHMGDVFVSASTSETQGLTYAEALASGLPCVCRKDGAIEGVIHNGVNGWQYETREEFMSAVHQIASDRALADRMGQEALLSARLFSNEVFYEGIMGVYEETLSRPRERRSPLPVRLRQKLYRSAELLTGEITNL